MTPGKDKIKKAKPSMVGRFCSFFGDGTPESTGDLVISSITTEVRGASVLIPEGTLQRCSCNYLSQSFLNPIVIALWLVLTWVFGGHSLATMQSSLRTTSLSIQVMPRHVGPHYDRMSKFPNRFLELLLMRSRFDVSNVHTLPKCALQPQTGAHISRKGQNRANEDRL